MFKDVEPDIIFRHFVWSVLFIAACAFYINNQILPNVGSYKEQMRFNRVSQVTLEQTRAINESVESKVNSFSIDDKQKLWGSPLIVNEKFLRDNMPRGFLKLAISKKGEEDIAKDKIRKKFYGISGEVSLSKSSLILDIVPTLHEKGVNAVLELPLKIKKNAKGNLDFVANISIVESTYKYDDD